MHDSVENCLKIYLPLAQSKGIRINADIDRNSLVVADKRMIDISIRNLLDNAIKYTPEGGRIILQSKYAEKQVEFSVTDSGKGLTQDKLKRLFNFDSLSGTGGLGLQLCREYIEKCGGRIYAESKGPGTGSKFCILLKSAKTENE